MKTYLIRLILPLVLIAVLLAHVAGYLRIPYLDQVEDLLYDTRVKITAPGGVDSRIVIVAVDEASLDVHGHWPWTRDKLALLVRKLSEYKVATVGFDMVFAERDESSDVDLLKQLASDSEDAGFLQRLGELEPALNRDRMLAESFSLVPATLGYYFHTDERAGFETGTLPYPAFDVDETIDKSLYLPRGSGYSSNLPELMAASYSSGFINNPLIDEDGIVRRAPLLHQYGSGAYESLALATAASYLDDITLPVFLNESEMVEGYTALEALELAGRKITIDAQGAVLVPYRGPVGSFPYISAFRVMDGSLQNPELLDGAIALVAATAPGLGDLRSTPFGSIYPGVEIHANVIAGLLDGEFRWAPAYTVAAEGLAVLVFGLVAALLLPVLSPLWATVATIATMLAVLGLNYFLWVEQQHVLPLALTLIVVFGIFVLNMVFGYLFETRVSAMMNDLFGQYVPPGLVQEMSRDPQHYSLDSERRELSVLFSDIRGFTSISEKLDATELSELLNRFLTPMTRVVHETRGTIDKYMGDAIMAFWGAPVHDPDHAYHAVEAGLGMLESLEPLNREFVDRGWPEIRIGVGVNSGFMSVGNMGSRFRRAYTVLGDAVNLGSRLEGLTKEYGVGFIVSEATKNQAPAYVYRELDRVRVKGKDLPVKIFEVLGAEGHVRGDRLEEVRRFGQFMDVYRNMQWQAGEQILSELETRWGPARLYTLYRERIGAFQENPPQEDWDGVFTHQSK